MQVGKLMFEVIVLIDHIGIFMFQFLNSKFKVIFLDGLDGAGRLFIRRQLAIAAIGVVGCFLLAELLQFNFKFSELSHFLFELSFEHVGSSFSCFFLHSFPLDISL